MDERAERHGLRVYKLPMPSTIAGTDLLRDLAVGLDPIHNRDFIAAVMRLVRVGVIAVEHELDERYRTPTEGR